MPFGFVENKLKSGTKLRSGCQESATSLENWKSERTMSQDSNTQKQFDDVWTTSNEALNGAESWDQTAIKERHFSTCDDQ